MIRALTLGLLAALAVPAFAADEDKEKLASSEPRVFELRTYITNEGKLDDLHKRFREHTCELFKKHGIELVGFWTPQDEKDDKENKLIYLIAFPSREAAKESWKAFSNDPEWKKVLAESHKDGVIVKQGGVGLPRPDRLQPDQVRTAPGQGRPRVSLTTSWRLSPSPFWRMCSMSMRQAKRASTTLGSHWVPEPLRRISSICIGVRRRR